MYIVVKEEDYESASIVSAHADSNKAIESALMLVRAHVDAWDVAGALDDLDKAGSLGPATRPVASWRVYDLYTYSVFELIETA